MSPARVRRFLSRISSVQQFIVRAALAISLAVAVAPAFGQSIETVTLDASAPVRPFPHYWEHVFGSGRAVLSLRESYREDLRALRSVSGVSYTRFHGILNDEVGVYTEDAHGEAIYNFSYVDQIYDGLLAEGVRPIVELSFMPQRLAATDTRHSFWYHPVIAPPKDYGRWDALITALATHLVQRYGIEEVSQWYFEVWNEPNLDFWAGEPKQSTYWTLYDHTARALKAVDQRVRVGGPVTAQAAWVAEFIRHCHEVGIPVDFISTHIYGDDTAKDVFKSEEHIPRDQMVCRAVGKVHAEIKASALPELPLILSEFNATYMNRSEITDTPFMGPWMAETIRQCDGLAQEIAYWTFSDVFEEQGVVGRPFYGGYGLFAAGHIPKAAFNAFALLHQLGTERFESASPGALVTRRGNGTLVVALWNYTDVGSPGTARRVHLEIKNAHPRTAALQVLDRTHGNVLAAYARMGSPQYPTQAQLQELRAAAILPAPTVVPLKDGSLRLEIAPDGLILVTLAATSQRTHSP